MGYDLYTVLNNQKALKNSFQATSFQVEEISTTFQGLAKKFKDFSRKNLIQGLPLKFKDFSRLWTLDCQSTNS